MLSETKPGHVGTGTGHAEQKRKDVVRHVVHGKASKLLIKLSYLHFFIVDVGSMKG